MGYIIQFFQENKTVIYVTLCTAAGVIVVCLSNRDNSNIQALKDEVLTQLDLVEKNTSSIANSRTGLDLDVIIFYFVFTAAVTGCTIYAISRYFNKPGENIIEIKKNDILKVEDNFIEISSLNTAKCDFKTCGFITEEENIEMYYYLACYSSFEHFNIIYWTSFLFC